MVLEEEKGQLALQCHPKVTKQSQACLKPRTEGIYSSIRFPNTSNAFTLAGQMPAVAIEQADALIERLGDNVNWYFISEARGNITLGEWDTTPHLWLKLGEGKLNWRLNTNHWTNAPVLARDKAHSGSISKGRSGIAAILLRSGSKPKRLPKHSV